MALAKLPVQRHPQPDPPGRHQPVRREHCAPMSKGSSQDVENARVALVLAMAGIAMFWRFLLRIVLAVVAVAVAVGAVVLLQGMYH